MADLKFDESSLTRREALKLLLALTGGTALTTLPTKWETPVIELGHLPAHAQVSTVVDVEPDPTVEPNPDPIPNPDPTPIAVSEFAVMATANDGNAIIIFPAPNTGLPGPAQNVVSGVPSGAVPHGVAYFGEAGALVADLGSNRILIVDLATNSLFGTIDTAPNYDGSGTIAVAPGSGYALASGRSANLIVITAPFTASSPINVVSLPDIIGTYQTQAIVFDPTGRAFVYHRAGISVLYAPYTSIAFTIPVSFNGSSGAIAISPTGDKLLCTNLADGSIRIFTAPFSATSTPEVLTINVVTSGTVAVKTTGLGVAPEVKSGSPKAGALDGINITPDGNTALVSEVFAPKIYAISAPFDGTSTQAEIPLPDALTNTGLGFEDIGISPDGQLAIATGLSGGYPAAFIQAPFTASGATVHAVDIVSGGRGAGSVRFQPYTS